jgi:hypothetical protein
LSDLVICKTRYPTSRTVLDQICAHGLNTVGLALGVAVKPHAFGVPLKRFQGWTAAPRQARDAVMP